MCDVLFAKNNCSEYMKNVKDSFYSTLELILIEKKALLLILHFTSCQDSGDFGKSCKPHLSGKFCDGTISDISRYEMFDHY